MAQSVTKTSWRISCHLTLLSHYWTKVKRRTLSSSWTEQSEKETEWKHWILEPVALTLKLLSRFHCQIYSSNRIECINHTHKGIKKKEIKEWCLKWIKNLICDHSKFGQRICTRKLLLALNEGILQVHKTISQVTLSGYLEHIRNHSLWVLFYFSWADRLFQSNSSYFRLYFIHHVN